MNNMCTQDWNRVILRRPSSAPVQKHTENSHENKIDNSESMSHDHIGSSIGKDIQTARIGRGFKTQKDLANRINVKPDVIGLYESGKAIPDHRILNSLRTELGIKLRIPKKKTILG
jgi:putative transcription factor